MTSGTICWHLSPLIFFTSHSSAGLSCYIHLYCVSGYQVCFSEALKLHFHFSFFTGTGKELQNLDKSQRCVGYTVSRISEKIGKMFSLMLLCYSLISKSFNKQVSSIRAFLVTPLGTYLGSH